MKISYQFKTGDMSSKYSIFDELMNILDLDEFLKVGLTAIAELVENVYLHAPDSESNEIEWSLNIVNEKGTITSTIEDCGQGIPSSIRKKLNDYKMESSDAIASAVRGTFENGRGQGLLSIRDSVIRGTFNSLSIESETAKYFHNGKVEKITKTENKVWGTRITFVVDSTGSAA